eukprot:GHVP01012402.1.p1 GENE.GHVP01012402.1~~GHVP01012402.1.p1  ORF type:complete len:246 (-),score=42.93 GHVP01012402.1:1387-2124(-)
MPEIDWQARALDTDEEKVPKPLSPQALGALVVNQGPKKIKRLPTESLIFEVKQNAIRPQQNTTQILKLDRLPVIKGVMDVKQNGKFPISLIPWRRRYLVLKECCIEVHRSKEAYENGGKCVASVNLLIEEWLADLTGSSDSGTFKFYADETPPGKERCDEPPVDIPPHAFILLKCLKASEYNRGEWLVAFLCHWRMAVRCRRQFPEVNWKELRYSMRNTKLKNGWNLPSNFESCDPLFPYLFLPD